jgi:hypothetical protein
MAKKGKYIVRVTIMTEAPVSKKAIREWVQSSFDQRADDKPDDTTSIISAKASAVDEQ